MFYPMQDGVFIFVCGRHVNRQSLSSEILHYTDWNTARSVRCDVSSSACRIQRLPGMAERGNSSMDSPRSKLQPRRPGRR